MHDDYDNGQARPLRHAEQPRRAADVLLRGRHGHPVLLRAREHLLGRRSLLLLGPELDVAQPPLRDGGDVVRHRRQLVRARSTPPTTRPRRSSRLLEAGGHTWKDYTDGPHMVTFFPYLRPLAEARSALRRRAVRPARATSRTARCPTCRFVMGDEVSEDVRRGAVGPAGDRRAGRRDDRPHALRVAGVEGHGGVHHLRRERRHGRPRPARARVRAGRLRRRTTATATRCAGASSTRRASACRSSSCRRTRARTSCRTSSTTTRRSALHRGALRPAGDDRRATRTRRRRWRCSTSRTRRS